MDAGMKPEFQWHVSDAWQGAQDTADEVAHCSRRSVGKWLDDAINEQAGEADVTLPRVAADRPRLAAPLADWVSKPEGDPSRHWHVLRYQSGEFGVAETSPIDELARELDQRQSQALQAGLAAVKALVNSISQPSDKHSQVPDPSLTGMRAPVETRSSGRARLAATAPFARAGLAAVLAVATIATGAYVIRSRVSEPPAELSQRVVVQSNEPRLPLPTVYGVYAISSGQLIELEALPGRVPDQRVSVSAAISRASRTTLPDGRLAFVVFRRDMASNAPERAQVRVVAKIGRAMTFDSAGKPRSTPIDDTWTIRNIAFEFSAAPVDDNMEMLLLRPETNAFTLPSGRYALVLKGLAYDFTVAGPITEPTQIGRAHV
jgi:hypothetical protein